MAKIFFDPRGKHGGSQKLSPGVEAKVKKLLDGFPLESLPKVDLSRYPLQREEIRGIRLSGLILVTEDGTRLGYKEETTPTIQWMPSVQEDGKVVLIPHWDGWEVASSCGSGRLDHVDSLPIVFVGRIEEKVLFWAHICLLSEAIETTRKRIEEFSKQLGEEAAVLGELLAQR
ncbi:MAG: hypothetical protein Q8R30_05935 [bacterium]|nr:hypothetical protein [bacterium]MDZ4285983.1 hypothetical protein [Candidatus Sungbacteria bacterium]